VYIYILDINYISTANGGFINQQSHRSGSHAPEAIFVDHSAGVQILSAIKKIARQEGLVRDDAATKESG
jgi:hypothetical protein